MRDLEVGLDLGLHLLLGLILNFGDLFLVLLKKFREVQCGG